MKFKIVTVTTPFWRGWKKSYKISSFLPFIWKSAYIFKNLGVSGSQMEIKIRSIIIPKP
jgi:hypothetical protein